MALDTDTIIHVAALARIKITAEEVPHYAKELSAILDLVEEMNQIDTNGIEPMLHPSEQAAPLRCDEVSFGNQAEELLKIAPDTDSGLYLVPQVIE